jgi:hypothetical protein
MILKQNIKKPIPISKSNLFLDFNLTVLLVFMGLAYFNNSAFLDRIILCSLIVAMVFFLKLQGNRSANGLTNANSDYKDPILKHLQ